MLSAGSDQSLRITTSVFVLFSSPGREGRRGGGRTKKGTSEDVTPCAGFAAHTDVLKQVGRPVSEGYTAGLIFSIVIFGFGSAGRGHTLFSSSGHARIRRAAQNYRPLGMASSPATGTASRDSANL